MGQCASSRKSRFTYTTKSRTYKQKVEPDRRSTPTCDIITKSPTTTTTSIPAPYIAAEDSFAQRGCKTPLSRPKSVSDAEFVFGKSGSSPAQRSEPPDLFAPRPVEPRIASSRAVPLEAALSAKNRSPAVVHQKGVNEEFPGFAAQGRTGERVLKSTLQRAIYPPNWGMMAMPPDLRSQRDSDGEKLTLLEEHRPVPLLPFSPFSSVQEVDRSQSSISICCGPTSALNHDRSGITLADADGPLRCNSLISEREEREAALHITPPIAKKRTHEEALAPVAPQVAPAAPPPPTFPPSQSAEEPISPPVATHGSWRLPNTAQAEKSRASSALKDAVPVSADPTQFPLSPATELRLDNAYYLPQELSAESDDDRVPSVTTQTVPSGMPRVTLMTNVADSPNSTVGSLLPPMQCRASSKKVVKPAVKTYRSQVTRDSDPSRPTTASDGSHDGLSDSLTNPWLIPPPLGHNAQPPRCEPQPALSSASTAPGSACILQDTLRTASLPPVLHAGQRRAAPCLPALPAEFTDFARACSYVDM